MAQMGRPGLPAFQKTDLSSFSQGDLNKIALQLNQRPRKTLNFASPAERFNESVALTD